MKLIILYEENNDSGKWGQTIRPGNRGRCQVVTIAFNSKTNFKPSINFLADIFRCLSPSQIVGWLYIPVFSKMTHYFLNILTWAFRHMEIAPKDKPHPLRTTTIFLMSCLFPFCLSHDVKGRAYLYFFIQPFTTYKK